MARTIKQQAGLRLRAAVDQVEAALREVDGAHEFLREHQAEIQLDEYRRHGLQLSRGFMEQVIETHRIIAAGLVGDAQETL